jgi:hypothetical protein
MVKSDQTQNITSITQRTDWLFVHIENLYAIVESTEGYVGFILAMRLRKSLDKLFRLDLPSYTHRAVIQKIIPLISQGYSSDPKYYFEAPIWLYVKAIECEGHSIDFVESNLRWALHQIYDKDIRTWTCLEEAYAKIIAERDISPEFLYELCDYERPGIWLPASQNLNCPEEGKTLLILKGNEEDQLVDFERVGR